MGAGLRAVGPPQCGPIGLAAVATNLERMLSAARPARSPRPNRADDYLEAGYDDQAAASTEFVLRPHRSWTTYRQTIARTSSGAGRDSAAAA